MAFRCGRVLLGAEHHLRREGAGPLARGIGLGHADRASFDRADRPALTGRGILSPAVLPMGFAVAVLSSAFPYTLETIALRSWRRRRAIGTLTMRRRSRRWPGSCSQRTPHATQWSRSRGDDGLDGDGQGQLRAAVTTGQGWCATRPFPAHSFLHGRACRSGRGPLASMNETTNKGGYRGDNARGCADQRYRSHVDGRRFAEEHRVLRGAGLRDRRAVGRSGDAARRDAASGQDPDRRESGRLEEGARPQEGNRRAPVHLDAPGSVDEIAKRAKNAGIALKSEPQDTEWKSRARSSIRVVSC